ncbi:MAG TPA: uracil-DNA glycosylase family protein [Rhodanobacteraceae bacterium]
MQTTTSRMIRITRGLARDMVGLAWHTPSHVYNPLQYAWTGHREYLARYGAQRGRVLLLGMNPGPWGMAQTGVPFGSVGAVRDWFRIDTRLARRLPVQHPKYPILGMACHRDEGSGKRLWGWAQARCGKPERFFERFFVWNYCPLLFLCRDHNLTPEGLRADEVEPLRQACDAAFARVLETLQPSAVVGIGRYAERRARDTVGDALPVAYLSHPSPASPAANRDWATLAEAALGPWLPARRR